MSHGDFFYFLSADDKLFPDTLRNQVEVMLSDRDCAVVCGNAKLIDAKGSEIGDNSIPLPENNLLLRMMEAPNLHDGSLLFRRSSMEKIDSLFFEPFENYHGFHHKCFRLARDFRIRYVDKFLVYQRVHDNNLSNPKHREKMIAGYEVLRKKMREYVQMTDLFNGLQIDDNEQMALAHYKTAVFMLYSGQYDLAYADLQKAHALQEDILDLRNKIPEMTPHRYSYPLGKYEVTYLDDKILRAMEPEKDPAVHEIIDLLKTDNLVKAFYTCRNRLEMDPNNADLIFVLSQIYLRQLQVHDSANRFHAITLKLLEQVYDLSPLHCADLYLWMAFLDEKSMNHYFEELHADIKSLKFFDLNACLWLTKHAFSLKNKKGFIEKAVSVFEKYGLHLNSGRASREKSGVRARKKLRVLFISPPYARIMGLGNCRFPLSFGNMATILAMNHHEVGIYDTDFDPRLQNNTGNYEYTFTHQHLIPEALSNRKNPIWDDITQNIAAFHPDIVGISAMTTKYPLALRIAQIVKEIDPRIIVAMGGHHPTMFGKHLVELPEIDMVITGEGELAFLDLVNRLTESRPNLSLVDGLIYHDGTQTVVNKPRRLLRHLDSLPVADRDLMINENYVSVNNMMTGRGCPFDCHYCGAQIIWQRRVRRRSIGNITQEISYLLSRSSSRHISFWDDSFTMDRSFVMELLKALKGFDGLTFDCITRLDLIDEKMLSELRQSGCTNMLFGIESGRDSILKLINKKMTTGFIRRQTSLVNDAGIPWVGFFIMGYPGETREDIHTTLEFMKELDPPYAEINVFNPLPGTRAWGDLERAGKVSRDMDFSRFSQSSLSNHFLESMDRSEFEDLALTVIRAFDKHNEEKNHGSR
jgi:radical SAM superfamily enzyme YgiQ (UPF0313 family)